jgi:fatty acid desaturase
MKADLKYYEDKEKEIIAGLAKYGRQSGILSFLRLIAFLGAVALFVSAYAAGIPLLYLAGAVVFIAFIVLCIVHGGIQDKVNYLT